MILARLGGKKQTNLQNMAEIVFWRGGGGGGVSEMKCVISPHNYIIPYEINNKYIEISTFFILGNKETKTLHDE